MTTSVTNELVALPELYEACGVVLGERTRRPADRVRGGLPGGLDLHEGALHARSRMLEVLASWSGLVASEQELPGPGKREVVALVAFLLAHVDWLAAHPAADDFAEEVRELAAEARRVTCQDRAVRLHIGACTRAGCGCPVWATFQADVPARVRCDAGHDWPPHQWLLLTEGAA